MDRYINLFTDYGFKKVFGEEPNKDLLIAFLNELLGERDRVQDLTYLNSERMGKTARERSAVFDLYCTNEQGEKFIVEIQRVKQKFFKDRSVYYSSFAIQEQAAKGKDWKYELKSVYTIGILDFCFEDSNEEKFHHQVKLMEEETKEVFYDKLTFIYLEVPKFKKDIHELTSDYERWLYAFKNLHRLKNHPEELKAGIFKRLIEIAEIARYNEAEQRDYQESLKDYWDLKSAIDTYYEEGKAEGLQEKTREIVINGLQQGVAITMLAALTGLSEEEIVKIQEEGKK
ncbi:MAG: Rpn family recombination-promoting nuclease/putative transposase [Candidatus Electrothrix aestuarii]|uniref:Rpn family recombination-promoting nuclease/putative transposase n=1 Tax=Candidatus Electrothrix aestuarii TaxID=3062594 RepID=A0AAU8LZB7_9BACT|nr:Rpn family recombination-promoting nuclease/putative transposase [Candidatus Electrothrix aestuarii]